MIWAFTGKTGSGKTFRMIKEAHKYWLDGVDIYSNTVLLFDRNEQAGKNVVDNPALFSPWERLLSKVGIKHASRGRISYFESIEEIIEVKNGLILFDEAQVLFNARQWENLPGEFQYKLQQHRKHQLDLFCTTQNLGTIDITYRRLIQAWFHCRNNFEIGHSPRILFGIYTMEIKDIDQIYNTVDELKADTIKSKTFFIHRFSKRLYDTMYDIGFRRFKTLWLTTFNSKMEKEMSYLIIPKNKSINDALKDIRLLKSPSNLNRSPVSRTN